MTWGTGEWFSRSSYGKYYMGGLGFTSQTLHSPEFHPNFVFFPFYTGVPFPFLRPHVNFTFLRTVLSSRPIPRVVGSCWKSAWARVWVWACQTPNSVLLCWRLFPLPCPYTQFVPFFGHLAKCRVGGRPRQWLSSAWAVDPKINWAWTRATISLAPHNAFAFALVIDFPRDLEVPCQYI